MTLAKVACLLHLTAVILLHLEQTSVSGALLVLCSFSNFLFALMLCLPPSGGGVEEPTGSREEEPGSDAHSGNGCSQTAV